MTRPKPTNLGLTCPSCGGRWFSAQPHWNTWECVDCLLVSAIRDGQMELASITTTERTEEDEQMAHDQAPAELAWHDMNKRFCDIFHRSSRASKGQG